MSNIGPVPHAKPDASFRPIHYIGNKSRFLDAIDAAISEVAAPGTTVCDLFSGTAVVSRRLAMSRPVVCSDIQAYSAVLARALTRPRAFELRELSKLKEVAEDWLLAAEQGARELLILEERAMADAQTTSPHSLADIIEHGSLTASGTGSQALETAKQTARHFLWESGATLTRYYGGAYFSYRQALELDALLYAFRTVWGVDRDDTALAALLGVASDLVSTVGSHFAQPIRPRTGAGQMKQNWVRPVMRSRRLDTMSTFDSWLARYASLAPAKFECRALHEDYRTTVSRLGPEVGAIYADPPYTRDHYSRFYHVLETIVLDDDPGVTPAQGSTQPSRGLYRTNRHQSPFSIRTQVGPAFHELFANAKRLDVPLVLSYSPMSEGTKARPETRLVSIDHLTSMASDYFSTVRLLTVDSSSHSRFNRLDLNAEVRGNAEVMIVASN